MFEDCKNRVCRPRPMDIVVAIILIGVIVLFFVLDAIYRSNIQYTGPDNWADLFPDACAGRSQSPIDIKTTETIYNPALKDFAIFFDPPAPGSKFFVHNNGHSIQVNTEGKFYVSNGGLTDIYNTAQFHFHWGHKAHHGSEHTVDGSASPIEMHIVNWNSDRYGSLGEAAVEPEGLAVLGIMFEISAEDNPILEPLINVLLQVRDPDMKIKAEIPAVSMRTFLPRAPDRYYRYDGSLTTPGCFESVVWTVFHEKQTISRRQLHVFRQVLKPSHNKHHKRSTRNARMVRSILGEIGIEDNAEERMRFRRQLEKQHDDPVVVAEGGIHEDTTIAQPAHYDVQPMDPADKPLDQPTNLEPATEPPVVVTPAPSRSEKVRQILVNNYRPVQPLNGRVVYRSFPFFDEPISKDVEIVYIEKSGDGNSAGIACVSFLTVICSVVLSTVF